MRGLCFIGWILLLILAGCLRQQLPVDDRTPAPAAREAQRQAAWRQADSLFRAGDAPAAVGLCRQLTRAGRQDAPAGLRLAWALAIWEDGQGTEAGQLLEEERTAFPGDPAVWRESGRWLSGRGRWEEAATCWLRAVDLDPAELPARQALAGVSGRLESPRWEAEARRAAEEWAALGGPADAPAKESRQVLAGRAARLESELREAPGDAGLALLLAATWLEQGGTEPARQALDLLAAPMEPPGREARRLELRARACRRLEQPVREAEALAALRVLLPGRVELALREGEAWLAAGNWPPARRAARAAQDVDSLAPRADLLEGRILAAAAKACAGRVPDFDDKLVWEAAAACWRRALERSGGASSEARRLLAGVEDRLPDAEDRFFNKYDQPRKECYKWLREP